MADESKNAPQAPESEMPTGPLADQRRREAIGRRAYARYCERGCADGFDVEDWLAAEAEVLTTPAASEAGPDDAGAPAPGDAQRKSKASA